LFPDAVTEVKENGNIELKVDFDVLKQELSNSLINDKQERYQMTWPGKKEAFLFSTKSSSFTLIPEEKESVNFSTTRNIYIKGDNLDALKIIRETYLGKIKMIYIDPPYNTGNDFVYNDNFDQSKKEYLNESGQIDSEGNNLEQNFEANGRFHSNWLSMIFPRLKVSRDLLSEDGLIFISIDDNEQANLKKVCDEIFGETNFVMQIAWRRTDNQPNIGSIARVKEYVLCYSKSISNCDIGKLPLTEKAKNEYRYQDEKGFFRRKILLDKTRGRYHYRVKTKNGLFADGPWMVSEEEFNRMNLAGEIYWTSSGDELPYGKKYLTPEDGQIPCDFWGIEYGTNQRASSDIQNLFGFRAFDFSKPVSLIKNLIKIGCPKEGIVLDFFAGSSTTGDAVMETNAEDGLKRTFILIQIPEKCLNVNVSHQDEFNTICDVGIARLKKIGNQILNSSPLLSDNLDLGFRVFKVDSSNMKNVYYSPEGIKQTLLSDFESNIKEDRNSMDLLFQVMLELGIPLSSKIEKKIINRKEIFFVGENDLTACFNESIDDSVINEMAKSKPLYACFKDSSFEDDSSSVNCEQIFKTLSSATRIKVL